MYAAVSSALGFYLIGDFRNKPGNRYQQQANANRRQNYA